MDLVALALHVAVSALPSIAGVSPPAGGSPEFAGSRALTPVGLVANRGQWADEVRFWARAPAVELTLLDDAMVFRGTEGVVTLRLPGPAERLDGIRQLPGRTSFFQASGSASDVPTFASVIYRDVAPGIDIAVRPDGVSFAYDLLLAPGADLGALTIGVEGAAAMELRNDGSLRLLLVGGPVEQRIGACWQVDPKDGSRTKVAVEYRALAKDQPLGFGFSAPEWNPKHPLVIDPTLLYCTYLGTGDFEEPVDIAVDAQGSVYVLAKATSAMPTTPGAFQPDTMGGTSIWIGKLSPAADQLEWATFLDGSSSDQAVAMAVDGEQLVITGQTWSMDFPSTPGAYQSVHNPAPGRSDVFVMRLDGQSGHMTHGTFFGGDYSELVSAMCLAPNGDVVLCVAPVSSAPPTALSATPGAFDTVKNPQDRMIVRLSADLSEVVFATWFPIARINALASDADGNVYFTGNSNSTTGPVPTTAGAFQTSPADSTDAVVGKLDPTGSQLLWCTYVGGSAADTPWGLAVDAARAVYIVGQTLPTFSDYPTTVGAFSNFPTASGNGFATKILADGSGLVWSTYIGGGGGGGGFLASALVDAAGNLTAVGSQNQPGWPTTPDALFQNYIGAFPSPDVVVTKFDVLGSTLLYSTFIGGEATDYLPTAAMDSLGRPHVAFHTSSTTLPITPAAQQPAFGGVVDIGLVAFDLPMMPWRLADTASKFTPHVPNLVGLGTLEPGSPLRLSLRGGKPFGLAWLAIGVSAWSLPIPGFDGKLYPSPDFSLPVLLGPQGQLDLTFAAPNAALDVHFQVVGYDPDAQGMLYFSNGLRTHH